MSHNRRTSFNTVVTRLNSYVNELDYENNIVDANRVQKTGDSMSGNLIMTNQSAIEFQELTSNGNLGITLSSPAILSENYNMFFPSTQGDLNTVLSNDGMGNLFWQPVIGTANQSLNTTDNVTFNNVTATDKFYGDISSTNTVTTNLTVNTAATISQLTVANAINGNLNGIVTIGPQPNITSVGTLNVLNINGALSLQNQNPLQLFELASNGTNYIRITAPSSLALSFNLVLPLTAGLAGQSLSLLDGNGNLSWAYYQPKADNLTALTNLNSIGYLYQAGNGNFEEVKFNGTTKQVILTSGSDVNGYYLDFSLPQNIDSTSSPNFVGLNLSGLTALQTVTTDSNNNLISLPYSQTGSASTICQRDSNGNGVFNSISLQNGGSTTGGVFSFAVGSMSLPSITFTGNTSNGFFYDSVNALVNIVNSATTVASFGKTLITFDQAVKTTNAVTIGNGLEVQTGNLTIDVGNLVITQGNCTITAGSLSVDDGITITTNGLNILANGATISGNTTINGGSVNIGSDTINNAINIGTSGDATLGRTITIGNTGSANTKVIISAGNTGKINLSGIITSSDNTDSSSYTTGSLILSGGLGVAKNVFIQTGLTTGGLITSNGGLLTSGISTINIGTDSVTGGNINIGTLGTRSITIGNNSASVSLTSVTITNGIILNSNGTTINIGTDNQTDAVNIGLTGKRTITLGTAGIGSTVSINDNLLVNKYIHYNSGIIYQNAIVPGTTITAQQLLSGVVVLNAISTSTINLPTIASVLALYPNFALNDTFNCLFIIVTNSFTVTLGSTSFTFYPSVPTTFTTNTHITLVFTYSQITPSQVITVY